MTNNKSEKEESIFAIIMISLIIIISIKICIRSIMIHLAENYMEPEERYYFYRTFRRRFCLPHIYHHDSDEESENPDVIPGIIQDAEDFIIINPQQEV